MICEALLLTAKFCDKKGVLNNGNDLMLKVFFKLQQKINSIKAMLVDRKKFNELFYLKLSAPNRDRRGKQIEKTFGVHQKDSTVV